MSYSGAVAVTSTTGSVELGGTATNGVTDGAYRGTIDLAPAGGGIDAIDVLPLDQYVAGVVPGEVDASWPRAALEAQAVAARSYALATDAGGSLFDQYADTRSQMYKGLSGEEPASTAAVRATAGQVVTYGGQVATTYFFSTSGGHTENVENVFYGSRALPYLRGVKDPYDYYAPLHRWHLRCDPARAAGAPRSALQGDVRADPGAPAGGLSAHRVRPRGLHASERSGHRHPAPGRARPL